MDINRKFPRLNLTCDIEYSIDNVSGTDDLKVESSKTKDISLGGMCFITYKEIPVGTILKLKFKLGNENKPLVLKGKITWIEKFNIGGSEGWDNGIQFLDIPEKDRYTILKYIDSML